MPTIVAESVADVLDDLVHDILVDLGVDEPPVDPIRVARGLGIEVRIHRNQSARGRIIESNGLVTISLRPEPRKERHHWTVAHEVGEYLMPRIADRWPSHLPPVDAATREWLANRFATQLLVPTQWFERDASRLGHDLLALKLLYRTASYEVLANRLLDVCPNAIVTIYDNGKMTRRVANRPGRPAPTCEMELDCRFEASRSGNVAKRITDAFIVRAWPIHLDGWKREILLTQFNLDD